jgi:dTDP-4-amino-4,6-dideoxygalactose transaminase
MGEFPPRFRQGIALFNAGEFFEAHEALEDAWRESSGEDRRFLQGLVQVAVGLHHHSTGNTVGARSVLRRALDNLRPYPESYFGIGLEKIRIAVAHWDDALTHGQPAPPLPKVEVTDARLASSVDHIGAKPAETRQKTHVGVPHLDLCRQYAEIRDEIAAAIERVCSSQHFILGEEVEAFEREASSFLGAAHTVGCASGSDALWLALIGAGVTPGAEVITTPFSFFASASAIVHAGARPVFVDIDPRTLNLSADAVEQKLMRSRPPRVSAILPVHLYGQCADTEAFRRIASELGMAIIEDAAQAFGAAWRGRRAGTHGNAAGFSFYPTKNLSAYGDGGCVATNDAAIADRVRLLRNHGSRTRYHHEEAGWNSRLDAMQAAILRVKLKRLEDWNAARREHAARYDALLREAGLLSAGTGPLRVIETLPEAFHIFHQYVVCAARRDELRTFLTSRNIGTEIYYPIPLHLQPSFAYLGYTEGDFPEAERAARQVIALPMFPELTAEEQRVVVQTIAEFYS